MLGSVCAINKLEQGEGREGFQGGSVVKNPAANAGDTGDVGSILGQQGPLEEEMATHSNILAWKIPWTEEPGGLYSPRGRKESDMTEHAHKGREDGV